MPGKLAHACVVVVASFLLVAGTAQADRVASGVSAQDPAEVREYWTDERMEEAIPLDLAPGPQTEPASVRTLREFSARTAKPRRVPPTEPENFAATTITDTTPAGIRTHGKIFASNPVFDYVCSGTVVTAPNQSTVWTAAHCIYDPDSNNFATNLIFVPGYNDGAEPFGRWAAEAIWVPSAYAANEDQIDDVGAARMEIKERSKTAAEKRRCNRFQGQRKRRCKRAKVALPIQAKVGSRGIAFSLDPSEYTYSAYGYPVNPQPRFDGEHMERCVSPMTVEDDSEGPPHPVGISCNMQGGSSGGGWVIPGQIVNGNVSYGYPGLDPNTFYSPYFDSFLGLFYDFVKDETD